MDYLMKKKIFIRWNMEYRENLFECLRTQNCIKG